MNLLNDIKKILKDDDDHHLKIEIDGDGVTVYLDYDPALDFEKNCVIPIHYTTIEEFCYIPHEEYCDLYKPNDFGIDYSEIKIINKIMGYLEKHKQELNELCKGCLIEERECYKAKHEEQSDILPRHDGCFQYKKSSSTAYTYK